MKKGLTVLLLVMGMGAVKAQTIQPILYSIYSKYDSLTNLTFDIKYTYTSDTLNGDFMYDELAGNYTMNGKKALFKLGDIEYMQNDSFFLTVYNTGKMIIVSDPRKQNSGSFLPMREVLDSLATNYLQLYTISLTLNDSVGRIVFTRKTPEAQFDLFRIDYDPGAKLLQSLYYEFREMMPDTAGVQVLRKKRLAVDFSRYRFDHFSEKDYDENKYIFFESGECKPVAKYEDYRIFYTRSGR